MGLFGHWYVILILIALVVLFAGPSVLPRLGAHLGRRMRETKMASQEAGRSFRDEFQNSDEPETRPPAG